MRIKKFRILSEETEIPMSVNNPEAATEVVKKILEAEFQEVVIALFLNSNNGIDGYAEISRGRLDGSMLDPRVLLKYAILCDSSGVILAHNHPSGNLRVSKEDMEVTKRVKVALEHIDVALLDHIIIGRSGGFSSMVAMELL